MTEKESNETPSCCEPKAEKAGFFTRIFASIDEKMKAKADAQAKESSCCCSSDKDTEDKGGKCC